MSTEIAVTSLPLSLPDFMTIQGHESSKDVLRKLRAHTLLFTGQEGVGRRLCARWYAALLNCQNAHEESRPCGACPSCAAMKTEFHPDYREIAPEITTKSGKLSRKPQFRIDDLVHREKGNPEPLRAWLEQRPHYRHRIGVIDHAESLNAAAANAFLKMLEEPPSYSTIILIAPDMQSVLATIASRSTPVRFGTVDLTQAENHPLAKLGRLGDVTMAKAHPEAFNNVHALVEDYVESLSSTLEQSFEKADALEKHWLGSSESHLFSVPELLRAMLSKTAPSSYAYADAALAECEKALERYATPSLAMQVLTLKLRELFV